MILFFFANTWIQCRCRGVFCRQGKSEQMESWGIHRRTGRPRGYFQQHFPTGPNYRRSKLGGEGAARCQKGPEAQQCPPFLNNETSVWVVSWGTLWQWWWRWEAEPLIISWQNNSIPCCLSLSHLFFFFFPFFLGGGRGVQCTQGGADSATTGVMLFLYDCETVCCGSNEYFWWALPLLFFIFLSYYKYYQKCCYACFCKRGRVSVFLFFCAWTQIVVLEEEDEVERGVFTQREEERTSDVMWCGVTGVTANLG